MRIKIIALTSIFKMRHRTKKSIENFLRSCIAKVTRCENMKCSGARQEVSEALLAGRGGVGKGEEMGVTEHCYVYRRVQCLSRGLWGKFSCSPLSLQFLTQFRCALPLNKVYRRIY